VSSHTPPEVPRSDWQYVSQDGTGQELGVNFFPQESLSCVAFDTHVYPSDVHVLHAGGAFGGARAALTAATTSTRTSRKRRIVGGNDCRGLAAVVVK
jgi:hypothetical protein